VEVQVLSTAPIEPQSINQPKNFSTLKRFYTDQKFYVEFPSLFLNLDNQSPILPVSVAFFFLVEFPCSI